tara:strand:+ start:13468 stop:14484 length:1017 start_codon:yes stop_codon:yes gene_type:complete
MFKNWFGRDKKSLAEELNQEETSAATVVVDQERSEENWVERLRDGLGKTRGGWVSSISKLFSGDINEEVLEEFEELLIQGDLGVLLTEECIDMLRVAAKQSLIKGPEDVTDILRNKFHTELAGSVGALSLNHKPFTVIMMVGINGVGKTTTTAKLAHLFKGLDKTCLLIAADTFRAGAVDQLKTWGNRLDCPVFAGSEGQDPASVAFDGISRARDLGVDLALIDTAGRLHTQSNLMEEVKKIARVIDKQFPGAPHEILMVIDATTGQNAIQQARIFHKALNLTGLVVTKLDGTAKGGSLLTVHRELKIPVRFIGVGEQFNDLEHFNPKQFTQALFHEV